MTISTPIVLLTFLFPQDLRSERVYYDGADDAGRLTGGVAELLTPLAPSAQTILPAPNQTLALGGAPGNRVDLVFVGDGYLASELGLYESHVALQAARFFQREPFSRYADYFNVHRVDVVSNESGVDNDPVQGIQRDTALGAGFWCAGIERLLCVNVGAAYSFANNAPDTDLVAVIANSAKYGGAGYPSSDLATVSGGNSAASEILLHEFGHALGDLADEYFTNGTTYTGGEPSEPNVSTHPAGQMANQMSKWFRWLGTDVPGFGGVISGYEGGRYNQFGIYRPTNNSLMRSLGRPFNMPSIEAILMEVYAIVDPIDDSSSTTVVHGVTDTLFVVPMQPVGHALDIQWSADGNPIVGATTTTLDLCTLGLAPGLHAVSVTVVDNTTWVRDEFARGTLMSETRTFSVDSGGSYCVAAANSAGPGARIGSTGSVFLSIDDFVLTVDGAPAGVPGIFFHGTTRMQAPFGNGLRCAGGATQRLPLQQVNGQGRAERPFSAQLAGIPLSEERLFQFWYRDPAAGGAAFNASDGLAATFCP